MTYGKHKQTLEQQVLEQILERSHTRSGAPANGLTILQEYSTNGFSLIVSQQVLSQHTDGSATKR